MTVVELAAEPVPPTVKVEPPFVPEGKEPVTPVMTVRVLSGSVAETP